MARNFRNEAIDILMGNPDWKQICVNIAKTHPSVLVKAAGEFRPSWYREAEIEARAGKKINAIKAVRVGTGWDLRTAKIYVEDHFGV